MSRRLSFVIVLCSHTLWSITHLNITPERFPHPSAYCCLKCCPHYFVLYGLPAEIPFQQSLFNLISGSKVVWKYKNLYPNLCKVLATFLVIVWNPRQTSHGHLFDVSHEVVNESSKDRVSNQPSDKETQPKSRTR